MAAEDDDAAVDTVDKNRAAVPVTGVDVVEGEVKSVRPMMAWLMKRFWNELAVDAAASAAMEAKVVEGIEVAGLVKVAVPNPGNDAVLVVRVDDAGADDVGVFDAEFVDRL